MILASGSPRRRQLLEEAGFSLAILPADVDETPLPGEPPESLVERLATLKATASLAVAQADAGTIVLGADTIVWIDSEKLGKPASDSEARGMLRRLSGRSHHVSTGICLLVAAGDGTAAAKRSFVETTKVTFHNLSDAEIDAYVASKEPADKAGSYGIQGLGRLFVDGIDGDYFNVVGLPVARVAREIATLTGHDGLGYLLTGN